MMMQQSTRATSQILLSVQNSAKSAVHSTQKCKYSTTIAMASTFKGNKFTFEGILAPVYTPFTADGEKLALDSIPKYSKYLSSKGIKGVLVSGTNGEGMVMSASERASVMEAWITAGHADKLHVQTNVGGTNIKDVLYLAKYAESCGADSILTLPELYYKPQSVSALVQYIKKIAEAAPSTPILFYHIPSNAGLSNVNLIEVMKEAGKEIPTFAGIKFTDGDLIKGAACASLDPEKLKVFLGANEVMSGAYLLGFKSATSATANICPALCLEIVSALQAGRLDDVRSKQKQLTTAIEVISQYGNRIACFKTATEIISGVPLGPTRFPIPALDEQAKEKLSKSLNTLNLP